MVFPISTAWAAGAEAAQPSILASLAPIVLICVVFYFLLIRPQQKQLRKHQEMVSSLKKGDSVVTTGGILAVVQKVGDDHFITGEIAPEVHIKIRKENVVEVLTEKAPALPTPSVKNKPNNKGKTKPKSKTA